MNGCSGSIVRCHGRYVVNKTLRRSEICFDVNEIVVDILSVIRLPDSPLVTRPTEHRTFSKLRSVLRYLSWPSVDI